MGGALTLAVASVSKKVSAAAPFYGLPPDNFDVTAITCPVQGHFAEHDDWCDPAKVEEHLTKKLKSTHEIFTYKDTHHAFTNEARPEVYNMHACETSLDRTLVFFAKTLF